MIALWLLIGWIVLSAAFLAGMWCATMLRDRRDLDAKEETHGRG